MATNLAELGSEGAAQDDDRQILLRIPPQAHSLAGFRQWVLADDFPDKLKVTFLKGEVYLDMSKEEIRTHAAVKTAIAGAIFNLNQEMDFGDLYINGVLVTNQAAELSCNPDAVAVFWDSLAKGKVHYGAKKGRELEIDGSPDWVLEIVSDSSVYKDLHQLRAAYHQAGIREYWLVDARGENIIFQILHWRKDGFVACRTINTWTRSRIFRRGFRLTRRQDRRGAWKYQLLSKPD